MELPSKFTALVCCIVLIVLAGAGTSLWGQTAGFAYVANFRSGDVSAYTIDGATGALMEVDGSPFPAGSGPWSVTVDPTGQFAYVANGGSNNVSAYSIDGTTGALTEIDGSPFPAGSAPRSVTVDPAGRFAYVANSGSNVSAYSIDGTTGALTEVAGSPLVGDGGPRGPIRLRGESSFLPSARERFGVRDRRDHRRADTGCRLALPGGNPAFLGGGGPHGPIRLRGEFQFQQRFSVHHRRDDGGADANGRLALPDEFVLTYLGDGAPRGPIRLRDE